MNNGPLKIVAIDDNEDSLMALRAVLVDALPEVQVLTAWNGRAGIELALAEDPDVILLALGLPEMDGYAVCRRLKADDRLSSIPVVLLAALRTDRQSRIKALEEGAHAFLSKPFDEAELIAQVRALARIKVAGQRRKQEAQRLAALVDRQARELEREFAERQRVEAVLRQSEECYRCFFDDGLTGNVVSTPEGQILLCNPAFAKIFGFASIQEAVGTDIRVLYPDAAERKSIIETLRQHGKVERLETWRKRRDGTLIHIIESLIGHCNSRDELCQIRSYIFDDTQRKCAEEQLHAHRHQLRALASELTLAEERERRRIAADLHDHACQDLVLAKMNLQTLLAGVPSAGGAVLRDIDRTLGEVIASVRELTFNLSSLTLYKFGLAAALEELLEDKLGAEQDLQRDFSDDGAPKPLSEDAQVLLFQSVREVLINILKHARAHKVALDIRRMDGSIKISVTDDGVGFDTDEVSSLPARHHGFGLFSIRERLDCIGGALEIDSRRGAGSRFTLVAPLQMESRDGGRKHEVGEDSARG